MYCIELCAKPWWCFTPWVFRKPVPQVEKLKATPHCLAVHSHIGHIFYAGLIRINKNVMFMQITRVFGLICFLLDLQAQNRSLWPQSCDWYWFCWHSMLACRCVSTLYWTPTICTWPIKPPVRAGQKCFCWKTAFRHITATYQNSSNLAVGTFSPYDIQTFHCMTVISLHKWKSLSVTNLPSLSISFWRSSGRFSPSSSTWHWVWYCSPGSAGNEVNNAFTFPSRAPP